MLCVHVLCVCVMCAGREYGDLDGLTFAVKDNLCVKGMTTTCASKFLKGWWLLVGIYLYIYMSYWLTL